MQITKSKTTKAIPVGLFICDDYLAPSSTDIKKFDSEFTTIDEQQPEFLEIENNFEVATQSNTIKIIESINPDSTINDAIHIPVKPDLYSILSSQFENETFETGIANDSEKIFLEEFDSNCIAALNTLSRIFMDNIGKTGRKTNNLVGALHIVSHINYKKVYPTGQMMAITAISNKNLEIAEFGIKCFENWGDSNGIGILNSIRFGSSWLQDYADEVIEELKNR